MKFALFTAFLFIAITEAFLQGPRIITDTGNHVNRRLPGRYYTDRATLSTVNLSSTPEYQDVDPTAGTVIDVAKCDYRALKRYAIATSFQWIMIVGFMKVSQTLILKRLPVSISRIIVAAYFAFMALKSRVFSSLDNARPSEQSEKIRRSTTKQPWWTPPRLAFPIIWTTIALLRCISSTMIWEVSGCNLLCKPILAMIAHLSIGDTWNTINNVEGRRGASVPGVFCVWLSVVGTTYLYYKTLPRAGLILLPSAIWISVANILIFELWRLNGKEPLYPVVGLSSAAKDNLADARNKS